MAAPEYRGAFKDQSFPLSPAALTVHEGDGATGYIELTNTGSQTWKAGTTKLAPIPRDTPSPFADASWLSPTRVSTVAAEVAPGAVGRFEVALDANAIGDTEIEFGLVEESVTWFADAPLGGGPADGFLKVHLVVVAKDAPLDAGEPASDAGPGVAPPGEDGGASPAPSPTTDGGTVGSATGMSGGCAVAVARDSGGAWMGLGASLALGAVLRRRRGDGTVRGHRRQLSRQPGSSSGQRAADRH